MLLNLIVHQPQAMLQVISHTPYWVWGMLAGLVGLGASQLRDRSASLLRTQLMPLGMAAFSVAGLLSAFGGSASSGVQAVGLWLAAAMPLALIVGIFLTKYFVGVELAMQPTLARDGTFALQISALYGVFNGLFAARALRMWRLAQQSVVYGASPMGA